MGIPTNLSRTISPVPNDIDLGTGLIPKTDVPGALERTRGLRAQIIDRWNATYFSDQVNAQTRAFLVQNANAFADWYKRANASRAAMDAAYPLSPEALSGYKGEMAPGSTLREQVSYYPAKVEKAAMKATRYEAGQSPAERELVRVAREMAIWGTQKPVKKPSR
jgi:hypothetical protein